MWCVGLVFWLSGIPASAGVPLDRIVVVVNDDVIMKSDLDKRMRLVIEDLRRQGTVLPPTEILRKQVLDKLVQHRLQIQIADKLGIEVDEQTLHGAIVDIADENGLSLDEFRSVLEQDGYRFDEFREQVRDELVISRLRQQSVGSRVVVNDREIDNYLANEELRESGRQEVRLSHILIQVPEDASDQELQVTKQLATQVLEDIRSGSSDFADQARALSASQTADKGGDLGWLEMSQVPSLFVEYVEEMKEGDISDIIESPGGYHMVKLVEVREDERLMVEQTKLRHILIQPDQLNSDEDVRLRLQQLRQRIEAGHAFSDLAKAHSMDPISALDGGDLGWSNPGSFVPEFEAVVDQLEVDELSEPFRTEFGWHIVQVLGRRQSDNTESVKRAQARAAIFERKMREAEHVWMRNLLEAAYVEYRID